MCLQMNINANEYNEYSENCNSHVLCLSFPLKGIVLVEILIHQSDLKLKDGRRSTHGYRILTGYHNIQPLSKLLANCTITKFFMQNLP